MENTTAEALAKALCAQLNADALGLMFLNREEESLRPLVYVPGAGTLFWETACASGTTAVGAWLVSETGRHVHMSLKQPGGILEIMAEPGGELLLTGTVRIMHHAETVVSIH
jgi:diaminopimelate epimerase